ncbi:MAG TPA: ABC transporter substrate-binding protein [Candidatus Dormibacteraeota bacterium]|nr:ABC transporter substrate-binding protein [Candidatus Dormibacteraeota bacterium]
MAATGLLLAGCGSSNNTSGTSPTGGAGGSASAAAGPPITIMTITAAHTTTVNLVQIWTGAQAAAARINSTGGINGSQLTVITCNDQGTPDGGAACAQQAVDQKAAAVVGSYSRASGSRIIPILEQAGIADIANQVVTPQDSTSKVAFPINGSAPALYAGDALMLIQQGAKHINVVRDDVSSEANLGNYVQTAVQSKGLSMSGSPVIIPNGTTDFAPIVAAAQANGTDGIVLLTPRTQATTFLKAAQQSGVDVKSALRIAANPNVIDTKTLGAAADGILVDDHFPGEHSGNATIDQAYTDIRAQPQDNIADTTSLNSYFGVMVFAQVAKKLQTVSAATVLAGLSAATSVNVAGRIIDFTKPNSNPSLARLFSSGVYTFKVQSGSFAPINQTLLKAL